MLIYLTRLVGGIAARKNRKAGWYKFLAVALWLGGEFIGGFAGGLLVALTHSSEGFIYLFALIGAAIGAGLSLIIAKGMPSVDPFVMPPPPPPQSFG